MEGARRAVVAAAEVGDSDGADARWSRRSIWGFWDAGGWFDWEKRPKFFPSRAQTKSHVKISRGSDGWHVYTYAN